MARRMLSSEQELDMKLTLASLLLAISIPAAASPDFESRTPRGSALAASDGTRPIMPQDDVTFTHASSRLSESAAAQVDTAARWLRAHPGVTAVIEGYADHTGGFTYNEDLAAHRAQAVRARLIANRIPSDRIVVVTFGEEFADPGGNSLDRRAIIYATTWSPRAVVAASLDRKQALSATWTERNAIFSQSRGRIIATR
jgi:outer membrane protein OmpA-like peptidoglycan-associated protein